MTKRQQAIKWWNDLSSPQKTQLCDCNTELIGSVRRWETLTGSEIEMLWEDKCRIDSEFIEMVFNNTTKI